MSNHLSNGEPMNLQRNQCEHCGRPVRRCGYCGHAVEHGPPSVLHRVGWLRRKTYHPECWAAWVSRF